MLESEVIVRPSRRNAQSDLSLLNHLRALTVTFERDGERVSAVLTYAEPLPDHSGRYHAVVAADTGYEGIACLDDTARAALLGLAIHERSGSKAALAQAEEWLTFAAYMQYPDGSFANFIRNAAGIRNASGQTSHRGGYWWSSRALWALARAYRITGKDAYRDQFEACHLEPLPDGKINAVLALAALELYRADPNAGLRQTILDHCATIVDGMDSLPFFPDHPGSPSVSLWGYHQLHAVATVAEQFDIPRWLAACRSTVRSLLVPDIRDRFWHSYPDRSKVGVTAYDIAPIVQGLAELHHCTGAAKYADLALKGCAWFYGRNDARTAMYDPTTGACRDGITDGVASPNCGAESSIEAGFAELVRRDLADL